MTATSSLSYDVWFNGDVKKQLAAGTFPQCRPVFEEWVKKGKISSGDLDRFDQLAVEHAKAAKEAEKKAKKAAK